MPAGAEIMVMFPLLFMIIVGVGITGPVQVGAWAGIQVFMEAGAGTIGMVQAGAGTLGMAVAGVGITGMAVAGAGTTGITITLDGEITITAITHIAMDVGIPGPILREGIDI